MSSYDFKNKIVLITGSSSGIGSKTAIEFARLGAICIINGRNEGRIEEIAIECKKVSPFKLEASKFRGDLGDDETIEILLKFIKINHGRLDILVNNAGVGTNGEKSPISAFDEVMKINLRSMYQICLKTLPLLKSSKGVIINVSSFCGMKPFPKTLAYCVSKAGVNMLSRCLAIDWGIYGIRVNCVCPGQINTPIFTKNFGFDNLQLKRMWNKVNEMYPLKRGGETDDVCWTILFLASDKSSFLTGTEIKVDGGYLDSLPLVLP